MFHLLLTCLVGATMVAANEENCTYWCRKPDSSPAEYICCDDGNPFISTTTEIIKVSEAPTATDGGAEEESEGCYYYCSYEGKVYCCGSASQPIPISHDLHEGRCPGMKEQVCKKNGLFLNSKAIKTFLRTEGRKLANVEEAMLPCASDGYCADEEKCCPNICEEKHTCMQAVYDTKPSTDDVESVEEF